MNILQLKVEGYRAKLDEEKWADYQKGMTECLDEEMKELMKPFEEKMQKFAVDKIGHIQGVVIVKVCMLCLQLRMSLQHYMN